jgi:competence protein ComFA
MFICENCGCSDEKYFGIRNNKPYCRRCISFHGEKVLISDNSNLDDDLKEQISYALSEEQEELSLKIVEAYANRKNSLIYAVCGAGKTELVYKVIAYALRNKQQVGFAIPRKDVVIELQDRIASAFPMAVVTSVYGGHTSTLNGNIIVLTTHQLYRYDHFFDLLIIDETDAFPYSNNETLMYMFEKSLKGQYIMMSATPLEWMKRKITKEKGAYFTLMKRYHGHPLIVPQVKIIPYFKSLYVIYKLKQYQKAKKPCFVFTPTIVLAEELYAFIKLFVKKGDVVHSKRTNRNEIISSFKKGELNYLVTTSVLERGVTLKNIQVLVIYADHNIYNDATLVQISGRVGRKIDAYDGEVIFVADKENEAMALAISKIKEANQYVEL